MSHSPSYRWLWMDLAFVLLVSTSLGFTLVHLRSDEIGRNGEPEPNASNEDLPNVVFIVLDTVRSDHLSLCGYTRPTSPNLSAFVADGAAYTCDAQAPATWTLPSHASFFTGIHPSSHHAHSITSGVEDWEGTSSRARRLRDNPPTLAEDFQDRGYQTRMLSSNPVVSAGLGLRRGFELGRTAREWGNLFGEDYAPALRRLMNTLEPDQPTFLFLNIADAHRPWQAVPDGLDWIPATRRTEHTNKSSPSSPWRRFIESRMPAHQIDSYLERVINNYDYAVFRADRVLGEVFETLEDSGFCAPGCRFVITSDHGEMLGEHQLLDHGHYVWQSNISVPLIYRDVGSETRPLPSPIDAIHAYHLARDGALPSELSNPVSEGWPHVRRCARTEGHAFCDTSVSIRHGNEKLIWTSDGRETREWLVDLTVDPDETNPLPLPENHPLREELLARAAIVRADASDDEAEPDTMELLEALGYAE